MSYSEEKIKVLNMVQEGKITAEEAIKLLDALEDNDSKSFNQQTTANKKQPEFYDELNKLKDKLNGWKKEFKDNIDQKDMEKTIEEITTKAEKIGKNVASATLGVTDRVLDYIESFVGSNVFNVFGNYNVVEKTYEAPVAEGDCLDLNALNGNIVLKKHLSNTVVIKARVRSSITDIDTLQTFESTDGLISLKQNNTANMSVSLEVYIPQLKFESIKLSSTNGKVYVEDSVGRILEIITTNSQIEVMGVTTDSLYLKSRNGKINSSYVIASDIVMETSNAPVDIKHMKTGKINVSTKNGKINVENIQNMTGTDEVQMNLYTTNAPVKVNLNDMEPRGYKIKGRTTNANINILIPQITYHNVNRAGIGGTFVEAETLNYSASPEKLSITVESTNGTIDIAQ